MKKLVYILSFMLISISTVFAQINREKELIQLSNDKWQWMSEKNVEKLEKLFFLFAYFRKTNLVNGN